MGANDLKISAAIRRELSSRRVDLSKIKFPVNSGEVTLEGEFVFVGLEKTNDEVAIELKFIESSIKNILGVSKINFELTNWKKNDSGIWESSSSSSSLVKNLGGEGLVCPKCDFVIRFCPCCGKPLVSGAKPGMHKGSINKPLLPKKPNIPPIKPVIRKPRPIGSPSSSTPSPVSNSTTASPISSVKSNNSISSAVPPITPAKKPLSLKKDEKTDNSGNIPINKTSSSLNQENDIQTKPEITSAVQEKDIGMKPVENANDISAINESSNVNSTVASKTLKPLKPLKPLGGLKPLNKVESTTQNASAEPTDNSINTHPVENSHQNLSVTNVSETKDNNFSSQTPTSSQAEQKLANSGFESNTPIPYFLKNDEFNNGLGQNNFDGSQNKDNNPFSSISSSLNNLEQSVDNNTATAPSLDLGGLNLDSFGTDHVQNSNTAQMSVPDLGSLDSNFGNTQNQDTVPNLDLGSLDSNFGNTQNQATSPDLDLGLGFNLGADIPTSPTPSSIPDLGLNLPQDNNGQPASNNIDLGFNIPDFSGNMQNATLNQSNDGFNQQNNNGNNQDPLDLLGNFNLDNFGDNNSSDYQAMQPQQSSNYSLDGLAEEDTPLPPMRPAQNAMPKKAPAKKKSDDLFASLFNDSGLGGKDGLGNLDLDNFEILSSGNQDNLSPAPAVSTNNQQTDSNPFDLGNVLDLDNMMGSGQKDNTGTFNLDDFDINNFKL